MGTVMNKNASSASKEKKSQGPSMPVIVIKDSGVYKFTENDK